MGIMVKLNIIKTTFNYFESTPAINAHGAIIASGGIPRNGTF